MEEGTPKRTGPKPKPFCGRGHAMTGYNIQWFGPKRSRRRCRACANLRKRNWYGRHVEKWRAYHRRRYHDLVVPMQRKQWPPPARADYFMWHYLTHEAVGKPLTPIILNAIIRNHGREIAGDDFAAFAEAVGLESTTVA